MRGDERMAVPLARKVIRIIMAGDELWMPRSCLRHAFSASNLRPVLLTRPRAVG
jgi:hypothetical protein